MSEQEQEWGEEHRREALRRTYEIAAELVGIPGRDCDGRSLACDAFMMSTSQRSWREQLVCGCLDPARIDREVALVCALAAATPERRKAIVAERERCARTVAKLAAGTHVVESGWRAVRMFAELGGFTTSQDEAREEAADDGDDNEARIVRVTRVRKVAS